MFNLHDICSLEQPWELDAGVVSSTGHSDMTTR